MTENMKENIFADSEHVWDTIADSFDATRRTPWQPCIDFITSFPNSSRVADIACGNARHLIPCALHCKKVVGVDISRRLLTITQQKLRKKSLKNIELLHANSTNLPLKENTFDAVLYIAALHNIPRRDNRVFSLKEIHRVLKPDGVALISVWARWQKKFYRYFIKQWFTENNEFGDINIDWKQKNSSISRFYHLYSKREFRQDILASGLVIHQITAINIATRKKPDNIFAVVKKQA